LPGTSSGNSYSKPLPGGSATGMNFSSGGTGRFGASSSGFGNDYQSQNKPTGGNYGGSSGGNYGGSGATPAFLSSGTSN